jgi:hypothetical protein
MLIVRLSRQFCNIHKNTPIVVPEHYIAVFNPAGEFKDKLKGVIIIPMEIPHRVA